MIIRIDSNSQGVLDWAFLLLFPCIASEDFEDRWKLLNADVKGESVGAFPGDNIIIEVCLESIEYVLLINVKFSHVIS